MKKLINQISDFKNRNILVIGDIIVDINTATKVIGFSAETPTIKAEELQSDVSMGGAGNVVSHILALGGSCTFVTVTGNDEEQKAIKNWSPPNLNKIVLKEENRKTCVKHRFWIEKNKVKYKHFQVNKSERKDILSETKNKILEIVREIKCDRVILSDYRLGIFKDESFVESLISACKDNEVYVNGQLSDGRLDYKKFKSANLIVINNEESRSITDWKKISEVVEILNTNVCITLGKNGSTISFKNKVASVPAIKVNVNDTCGAGDAFLACLSLCDSSLELDEKLKMSNSWAGLSTEILGTTPPSKTSLIEKIQDF